MTDDIPRYEPPYMSVKPVTDGPKLIFPKINVELTPQPEPIQLVAHTYGGDLTSTYDPAPAIGGIISFFAWQHSPPVTVISEVMEGTGCSKREAREFLKHLYCDRVQMCVETACNYVREGIQFYLEDTLTDLRNDAMNRTFAARNGRAFTVKPIEGLIRSEIIRYRNRQRRLVNLPTRGGKRNFIHDWTEEDKINLAHYYKKLNPLWRLAKKIYRKYPATYKKEIEDRFLFLPEDLIEKLAESYSYDSSASNLAVEHAAREIGIAAGAYSAGRLQRYRRTGQSLPAKKDFWSVKVWV